MTDDPCGEKKSNANSTQNKAPNFELGEVILIDKPIGWTSFDVVKKIRNLLKIKKIGHAGTLDPLADGLLVLCTGKKTKTISSIQEQEKEYVATICLGATTPSYDKETEITNVKEVPQYTTQDIQLVLATFVGKIQQKPPIYSAIKKGGRKLYEYAREGKFVEIKPREVFIKDIKLLDVSLPYIKIRVICSKGTYIRSLTHDIGVKMETGGYLDALTRTRIGVYELKNAYQIEDYLATIQG